jgi:predicted cobalt transporter CbtA
MRRGVLPVVVRAAPRARHKVFSWSVPGRANGRPFTIRGSLGYAPRLVKAADHDASNVWWLAGAAVVAVALGAVVVVLRRIAP